MLPRMDYVMKNSTQWEKGGNKNACRLCGQYIQKDENYSLIVVPMEFRKQHGNFIVHAEEWNTFIENESSESAIIEKLLITKKPTPKNSTKVDEVVVEAFKKVLKDKGYRIKSETRNRIYFKTSRNVAPFYFEKRFKNIEFEGRANGLFDRLYLREFCSKLNEALQKELGNHVFEGFRVKNAIDEAVETVNNLMK